MITPGVRRKLNYQHPLTAGLVLDLPLLYGAMELASGINTANVSGSLGSHGWSFNGTSQFMSFGHIPRLAFGLAAAGNDLTVQVFFNTSVTASTQILCGCMNLPLLVLDGWAIGLGASAKMHVYAQNLGLVPQYISTDAYSTNAWQSVAASVRVAPAAAPTISGYVNGKLSANTVAPVVTLPVYGSQPQLALGGRGITTVLPEADWFGGRLGIVRIWNRLLSSGEVVEITDNPLGIYEHNTFWPSEAKIRRSTCSNFGVGY